MTRSAGIRRWYFLHISFNSYCLDFIEIRLRRLLTTQK
jgi:hypothetical protein